MRTILLAWSLAAGFLLLQIVQVMTHVNSDHRMQTVSHHQVQR